MLPTRHQDPIPAEAPRAPTQAEWDAMTQAEQDRVIDELFSSDTQEELDQTEAMAESEDHYDAKEEARDTLRRHFERSGQQVYVGAERLVLYPGQKGFTPDLIVVVGVSPHKRDCWMVSREGRGIDVIIEIFYKGKWKKDFVDNVKSYAALGVPEYFIYDIGRQSLTGYRLSPEYPKYVPIARRSGRYPSEKLGLELAIRRGRLRFFQGLLLVPSKSEIIAELEEVAEQEQARAEAEQSRAEEFLVVLRESLLNLLQTRGMTPTEVQGKEIFSCSDAQRLRRWFDRALSTQDVSLVFNDD